MKKQRKHYSPEEKVAILRRHLLQKEPISNGKIERWHKSLKAECIRPERRCRSMMRADS